MRSALAAVAVLAVAALACRSAPPPEPAHAPTAPAVAAPRPEPPPPPEPPAPPAPPAPPSFLSSDEPLPLSLVTSVEGPPERARTSGQETEGTATDVAFLPPDGRFVVITGNDDHARIVDTEDGKQRWRSKNLRKDAERVAVCGVRFWVTTYGGSLFGFEWVDDPAPRVIRRGRAELGHGELRGCFGEGGTIVHATLNDDLVVFNTLLSSVATTVRPGAEPAFASRVSPYGWIAVPGRPEAVLKNLATGDEARPGLTWQTDEGTLMQAHVIGDDALVTERCQAGRVCIVTLRAFDGTPRARHRLDAAGSVWAPTVPSRIAVSPDATWLAWYRDGVPITVVELRTGRRASIPPVERTMASVVNLRSSPFDASLLAVTMTPAANQVSFYRVGP